VRFRVIQLLLGKTIVYAQFCPGYAVAAGCCLGLGRDGDGVINIIVRIVVPSLSIAEAVLDCLLL
jgi:hypothetical protein